MRFLSFVLILVAACSSDDANTLATDPAVMDASVHDAAVSHLPRDAAAPAPYVNTTSCPDDDAGMGCCWSRTFCGVMIGTVCFPRMALPELALSQIACDDPPPPGQP